MSNLIHKEFNLDFKVEGLMGKGIQVKEKGLYIAFTAGTGILSFLDLVGSILIDNLEYIRTKNENNWKFKDIKFILYTSFPSTEDVLGYELCSGLDKLCQLNSI